MAEALALGNIEVVAKRAAGVLGLLVLAMVGCRKPSAQTSAPDPSADWREYEQWFAATKPAALLDDAVPMYRVALADAGVDAKEIDRRVASLSSTILERGRVTWNRVLTSPRPHFNDGPNRFLIEMTSALPPGRALDCAMGQGRNALYLASRGWEVTGFDIADEALEEAKSLARHRQLAVTAVLQDAEHFDFGIDYWDLIVDTYAPVREVTRQLKESLKPGGYLLIEGFREGTGSPVSSNVAFRDGELRQLFSDLNIIRYDEPKEVGDFGGDAPRPLVRLFAQKRPQSKFQAGSLGRSSR